METLVSEHNPLLKEVRRAAARGSLTEDGYAVAEGPHLLEEALASGIEIAAVIGTEPLLESRTSRVNSARVVTVPDRVFAGLTTTEQSQGVITLVRPRTWKLADIFREQALAIVLDGLQDPGNAGAVVRSAEAFGATGVVFLKGSVNPYNPKCLRASAGSLFRLPVVVGVDEDTLDPSPRSNERGYNPWRQPGDFLLYTAMPAANHTLDQADFTKSCAIVIGGEGKGVRASLASRARGVRIPTTGVESLNAAVACGVILYEARRQRSRA